MSNDASGRKDPAKPEAKQEEVEGRGVYVARDASGIAAISEHEGGADPRVTADAEDNDGDDDAAAADRDSDEHPSDA